MATTIRCDMAIVGGGLAGGLIALAMAEMRPGLDVRLIEGGDTVGGNHIWSFFASDVGPGDQWIVDKLIAHRWPRYAVAFPKHRRVIDTGYRFGGRLLRWRLNRRRSFPGIGSLDRRDLCFECVHDVLPRAC